MPTPAATPSAPAHHLRRLAGLLACVFVGLVVGLIGSSLSGSSTWYLAIPAAITAGWWWVADPTQCETPHVPKANPAAADDAPG